VWWITIGTTLAALSLSYRNQFNFATQRGGYPVWQAVVFPVIIDSFVIVGELRLFGATARNEGWRIKTWAWLLTALGLLASVAAGIAHVGLAASADMKLAAAVAPLAAAASLGTGLGLVKLDARKRGRRTGSTTGTTLPEPARRSRARQPGRKRAGAPSPADLATWIAADEAAGLPMGRASFARRHGISEHSCRDALAARGNGHPAKLPA